MTPSTASPFSTRYSRSAPATQDSSTSLTEAPSALPTALTSASGSGSAHATRLRDPGLPLKRVGESWRISASFAISRGQRAALLGQRDRLRRVLPDRDALLDQRRADLARGLHHAGERLREQRRDVVLAGARLRACGGGGSAGGPFGAASVIDSITWTSAMPSA